MAMFLIFFALRTITLDRKDIGRASRRKSKAAFPKEKIPASWRIAGLVQKAVLFFLRGYVVNNRINEKMRRIVCKQLH